MITDLKNILLTITMIMAAAFVTSCSDDDSLASRGLETVEMPISISIPAEGFVSPTDVGIGEETPPPALSAPVLGASASSPAQLSTRVPGDPGTTDTLALPKYLYIYLVSTTTTNTTQVIFKKQEVKPKDWKLSTSGDNTNNHFSSKNGLYVYQGHLSINLPLNRKEGRVYVAASNIDLDDSSTNKKIKLVTSAEWTDEETFLNAITFSNDGELRKNDNMKNLYSSPYNLNNADSVYYGTIKDYSSNVPHIDMVLYHVATKVDLQWTIDEQYQGTKEWPIPETAWTSLSGHDMRTTTDNASAAYNKVFFSYIEARLLPKEKLPIFKPMGLTESSGSYDLAFLGKEVETGNKDSQKSKEYYQVLPDAEKSGMYYGRKVIYVIPQRYPSGDYYIPLKIMVNNYTTSSKTVDESNNVIYKSLLTEQDHATTGHHAYIKIASSAIAASNKDNSRNPIFTPWIRASLHVKSVSDVENLVKFTNPDTSGW